MTVLTLDRTASGQYALGEVGSLRNLKRFSAEIRAGDAAWTLRRALGGVGQVINASDSASGARVGRYVPHGFLHLRGVFGGTLTAGETSYDWRAKHQLSSHFAVSSAGVELAHFDAGGGTLVATTARAARVTPAGLRSRSSQCASANRSLGDGQEATVRHSVPGRDCDQALAWLDVDLRHADDRIRLSPERGARRMRGS